MASGSPLRYHTSVSDDGTQVTIRPELPYDLEDMRAYVREIREKYFDGEGITFSVWPGLPITLEGRKSWLMRMQDVIEIDPDEETDTQQPVNLSGDCTATESVSDPQPPKPTGRDLFDLSAFGAPMPAETVDR